MGMTEDPGRSDVLVAFLMSKRRGRRFHLSLPGKIPTPPPIRERRNRRISLEVWRAAYKLLRCSERVAGHHLTGWNLNSEKRQYPGGGTLGRLIAFDEADRAIWPVEEIQRILRMQLGARLHVELGRSGLCDRDTVLALTDQASPPIRSVADLLYHPRPPMELLWAVKDFSKNCKEDATSDMAPEVALALYYASIAAALTRRGERITTLSDDELRAGLNWVVKQNWLPGRMHNLIGRAIQHLRLGRHLWRKG